MRETYILFTTKQNNIFTLARDAGVSHLASPPAGLPAGAMFGYQNAMPRLIPTAQK
jgi:hypothetical protein